MSEQGSSPEQPRPFVLDTSVAVKWYLREDLMPRAAEITLETGVIIYDALFLALAEDSETVVITADSRLLKALEGTTPRAPRPPPGRRRQPRP